MTVDLATGKQISLTKEQEKLNLHNHGTKPWRLLPVNVLQAAQADIEAIAHNAMVYKELQKPVEERGVEADYRKRKYNFFSIHVVGQKSAKAILETALKAREGIVKDHNENSSLKRDQALLYESEGLLKAALELAE